MTPKLSEAQIARALDAARAGIAWAFVWSKSDLVLRRHGMGPHLREWYALIDAIRWHAAQEVFGLSDATLKRLMRRTDAPHFTKRNARLAAFYSETVAELKPLAS